MGRSASDQKPASSRTPALTIRALIRDVTERLEKSDLAFAHGTPDPEVEAAFIVGETLGLSPDDLPRVTRRRVTCEQEARVSELVTQRIATRKPAAYLLKKIYLRGVPFTIDERAIVPRSYLAELLDSDLFDGMLLDDSESVARVLDLCTGSGCLAVLSAMRFPHAQVDAVDLSADALELAAINVQQHGLTKRVQLHRGDLYAPLGPNRYDLIITNPPYVDAEGMAGLPPECQHEPAMAFDGGVDGIELVRKILDDAGMHLSEPGGLLCEVGRCRPALEAAYPDTPFLWLDTEDSAGEVFWLTRADLPGRR